jgi:hypothetical protein
MATAEDFEAPRGDRSAAELERIIRYQRWLIAVVLMQLTVWGGFLGLALLGKIHLTGNVLRLPVVLTFILGGVGAIFVFLLSWELRGAFAAIAFGGATVFPVIGLLILTLVNGYATTELRKHGIKVGTFGAPPGALDKRQSLYDDEDAGW